MAVRQGKARPSRQYGFGALSLVHDADQVSDKGFTLLMGSVDVRKNTLWAHMRACLRNNLITAWRFTARQYSRMKIEMPAPNFPAVQEKVVHIRGHFSLGWMIWLGAASAPGGSFMVPEFQ